MKTTKSMDINDYETLDEEIQNLENSGLKEKINLIFKDNFNYKEIKNLSEINLKLNSYIDIIEKIGRNKYNDQTLNLISKLKLNIYKKTTEAIKYSRESINSKNNLTHIILNSVKILDITTEENYNINEIKYKNDLNQIFNYINEIINIKTESETKPKSYTNNRLINQTAQFAIDSTINRLEYEIENLAIMDRKIKEKYEETTNKKIMMECEEQFLVYRSCMEEVYNTIKKINNKLISTKP